MAKIVFVTGTGTGVGKTVASAGLTAGFAENGLRAAYWKPVQTGVDDPSGGDTGFVRGFLAALGLHARLAPPLHSWKLAASPHLAARLEGASIDFDRLHARLQVLADSKDFDVCVVEGVGGLMVPLTNEHTVLDLITGLELQAVLVCPMGLGAINHSLLSAWALWEAKIPTAGLIFVDCGEALAEVETDNLQTIPRMSNLDTLCMVRKSREASNSRGFAESVLEDVRAAVIRLF